MREIKLTKGKVAIVDDEDFEWLNKFKWSFAKRGSAVGAMYERKPGEMKWGQVRKRQLMHRVIMKAQVGFDVDHINGNQLDNRKINLRLCKHSENLLNKKTQSNNTHGVKGVSFVKHRGKWRTRTTVSGVTHYSTHKTFDEAIEYRRKTAIKMHGEFAFENRASL